MGHSESRYHREKCSACAGLGSVRHGRDARGEDIWWECGTCDGTREVEVRDEVWVEDFEAGQQQDRPSVPDFLLGSWPQPTGAAEEQRWLDAVTTASRESVSARASLESLDENEVYSGRYRAGLEQHGVLPGFVPLYGRVLAESQAAEDMSYETWRDRNSAGTIGDMADYLAGEVAEELLEAVVNRLLAPERVHPFVGMAIDVSGGLQSIVDEARWDQPDDEERLTYRRKVMFTAVMGRVADQLTSGRQPRRNQVFADLMDQSRRFELWLDTDARRLRVPGPPHQEWRADRGMQ